MAAVPDMRDWRGRIDLVSVDLVARTIVRDVFTSAAVPLTSSHDCGAQTVAVHDIAHVVDTEHGQEMESISFAAWVNRARTVGLSEVLAKWLMCLKKRDKMLPIIKKRRELGKID
jgi:hypothetical protein